MKFPQRFHIAWCAWIALSCCPLADAQESGWRRADGKFTPDTDSRKSAAGFAGWVLTTSDPDWEAKWNTPEHETPSFAEATTVRMGERVFTLIFLVNPKTDARGEADVRCDLKVTRPNGTVSIDRKNVECMKGPLKGSPFNLRLAAPVLGFVGEAADPVGVWRVDVSLRDVPRDVTMDLHTSFELIGEAPPAAAR